METRKSQQGVHPLWWAVALMAAILVFVLVCSAFFAGTFRSYVPVTLTSDRAGLVMESGAKVKLREVEVGRVAGVVGGEQVSLKLEIFPDQVRAIPANVLAEIKATTAFGGKYVDLIYPDDPSPKRLTAGTVLHSRNVGTEVNTVFDNLVGLLKQIDVAKLNGTLTALADGVRGQGERMGQATTDANQVLLAINPRMDTVAENWRSLQGFSDAYGAAAQDILSTMDAASTTSATITARRNDLDALLLNATGFANSGIALLGPNKDNFVTAVNVLEPTTALLLKYSPTYACTMQGANIYLETSNKTMGGDGRTTVLDAGLAFGDDLYRYPENLPIVAAKGGAGGKPSCGSLPDASKMMPVRQLVTNTGWGTGVDWRPNPGVGQTCSADYFPVTRAVPEAPHVGQCLPGQAPGPAPAYPGGPAYGAPWYGPDGAPLYPGLPPAPAPTAPTAP